MINKLKAEWAVFRDLPMQMKTLLQTNMVFAFVLPIVELFVGAYIMRNSDSPSLVIKYQMAVYTGIPFTFLINGFLLRYIDIRKLYSLGMLLSGISMYVMMQLKQLDGQGIALAGLIMGISYGLFWANRDFLALDTTNDSNRNYYYGVETFFYTICFIVVPMVVGAFLGSAKSLAWLGESINAGYQLVTVLVIILTVISSIIIHRVKFDNPKQKKFIYFRFENLWNRMLALSGLKGMVQGYLVTAPAILIMKLLGDESTLGGIQAISGIITAFILYWLGRNTAPKHRIYILSVGILIFLIGTLTNGILYSGIGVIVFVLCKVLFLPLHDIAYFPIQMKVIDVVSEKEKRSEFAYIFNHEFGLFIGRVAGLGLFIILEMYASEEVALRYALIVVAILQVLSIPLAKLIVSKSDKALDHE
ncbi:MFS transporter [Aureibacter tunicatorum]|uniref:YQGE family putative transporter n=1 Tax=Aureibacter tunicatorum TaxID=866807 RepID=A0AAE4BU82_9BACT|nr:MFS transporter [Aureibacter tunicatorum]MDR6241526.1 YQGE family putative transporter [Aureibacter tunicatorum]BDD07016.1 hypothetical protein AUTU_44990 [Aureibacter tunicatorum]